MGPRYEKQTVDEFFRKPGCEEGKINSYRAIGHQG